MQCRGRSQVVSQGALARKASEERRFNEVLQDQLKTEVLRRFNLISPDVPIPNFYSYELCGDSIQLQRSRSPSPSEYDSSNSISPDYYEMPPSPPAQLQEDIQTAYARQDFLLAKILLLKLRGIEVTGEDDPRIDEITDEDFEPAWFPYKPLKLDPETEATMMEERKRIQERWQEEMRKERLRMCEMIWEEEKVKLRELKLRVLKKKEEEAAAALLKAQEQAEERERIAHAKATEAERKRHKDRLRSPRSHGGHSRSLLSYDNLSRSISPPVPEETSFYYSYDLPVTPKSPRSPRSACSTFINDAPFSNCITVAFQEVYHSMQGPLFPLDAKDDILQLSPPLISRGAKPDAAFLDRQRMLLSELLTPVVYEEGERLSVKAKGKARMVYKRKPISLVECKACTGTQPPTPSTSSASSSRISSRSNSWLSFGSARSSSTNITTPLLSRSPSWFKLSSASSLGSYFEEPAPIHSCRPSLTAVDIESTPLGTIIEQREEVQFGLVFNSGTFRRRPKMTLSRRIGSSVSTMVDFAKGLQTAYINANTFSIAVPTDNFYDQEEPWTTPLNKSKQPTELQHVGCRVSKASLSSFLTPTTYPDLPDVATSADSKKAYTCTWVRLIDPNEPVDLYPQTRLERPFELVFPRPLPPPRSPLALLSVGDQRYRHRPIGNPEYMRLLAFSNQLHYKGLRWEGKHVEGSLAAGMERRWGVAWSVEGSCLRNEVVVKSGRSRVSNRSSC